MVAFLLCVPLHKVSVEYAQCTKNSLLGLGKKRDIPILDPRVLGKGFGLAESNLYPTACLLSTGIDHVNGTARLELCTVVLHVSLLPPRMFLPFTVEFSGFPCRHSGFYSGLFIGTHFTGPTSLLERLHQTDP